MLSVFSGWRKKKHIRGWVIGSGAILTVIIFTCIMSLSSTPGFALGSPFVTPQNSDNSGNTQNNISVPVMSTSGFSLFG
ncbi:MAG: hypothetical protein PHO26_11135, partial [Dehalococcoidia bacterium]|nr:hypothetical protein [Dehalococcoidia bacterium]